MALSNLQKLYVAVLALGLAVAFGRSTASAIDMGVVSEDLLATVQVASAAGLVANLLSAALALGLVIRVQAPLPLAFKSIVGGPLVLWELKAAASLEHESE